MGHNLSPHFTFVGLLLISLFCVLILCVFITVPGLHLVNNANFTDCYDSQVASWQQNCDDVENQVCLYGSGSGELLNPDRIFITLSTCERICGDKFGFWDLGDILLRVCLWVVPGIVLLVHFHFPPLPAWNYGAVMFRVVGDPVDCLWSMLCRIQTGRMFYHKALEKRLKCARAVATIWCAYEEMGFHDASQWFCNALEKIQGQDEDFLVDSRRPPLRVLSNVLTNVPRNASEGELFWSRVKSWWPRNPEARYIELLDFSEGGQRILRHAERATLCHIERAAHQLVSNRSHTALPTWVAIFGLVSALGGAYVRTWTERLNNQTAHTIATVTLLFVIIPIIKLSGNIGAFTSSTAAIDVIQELRQKLGPNCELFPPLLFEKNSRWDSTEVVALEVANVRDLHEETAEKLQLWPKIAVYSGMNSAWRPGKYAIIGHFWSRGLLLASLILVLGCSYTPALIISYFTPLKGFACRSLAWTMVAILWVVSLVLDATFKSLSGLSARLGSFSTTLQHWSRPFNHLSSASTLWWVTVSKDINIALLISAIVAGQQLGLYNTCYCRSGALRHIVPNYVNLTPLTDSEWIQGWWLWISAPTGALSVNVIFIILVERFYSDSRKLLNRSRRDREENLIRINELARRVGREADDD